MWFSHFQIHSLSLFSLTILIGIYQIGRIFWEIFHWKAKKPFANDYLFVQLLNCVVGFFLELSKALASKFLDSNSKPLILKQIRFKSISASFKFQNRKFVIWFTVNCNRIPFDRHVLPVCRIIRRQFALRDHLVIILITRHNHTRECNLSNKFIFCSLLWRCCFLTRSSYDKNLIAVQRSTTNVDNFHVVPCGSDERFRCRRSLKTITMSARGEHSLWTFLLNILFERSRESRWTSTMDILDEGSLIELQQNFSLWTFSMKIHDEHSTQSEWVKISPGSNLFGSWNT